MQKESTCDHGPLAQTRAISLYMEHITANCTNTQSLRGEIDLGGRGSVRPSASPPSTNRQLAL